MAMKQSAKKQQGEMTVFAYIAHFALFVGIFFAIVGGALFILQVAAAYTP